MLLFSLCFLYEKKAEQHSLCLISLEYSFSLTSGGERWTVCVFVCVRACVLMCMCESLCLCVSSLCSCVCVVECVHIVF